MESEEDETAGENANGFDAEDLEAATPDIDNAEVIARARETLARIDPISTADLRNTIEAIQRISAGLAPILRAQQAMRSFSHTSSALAEIQRTFGGMETAGKASKAFDAPTHLGTSRENPAEVIAPNERETVEKTDERHETIGRVENLLRTQEARLNEAIVSNELLREINGKLTTVSLATVATNEHLKAEVAKERKAKNINAIEKYVMTVVAILSMIGTYLSWQLPKSTAVPTAASRPAGSATERAPIRVSGP